MNAITIRKPDDFHTHLRRGFLLPFTTAITAVYFRRALVMPNTRPDPVLTGKDALQYKREISIQLSEDQAFEPLMTIQITDDTTPEMIREAHAFGVIAGKIYPIGVTTNSNNGVRDFWKIWPALTTMQEVGMVLCIHGESMGAAPSLKKESVFIDWMLKTIITSFHRLKIILEHITTRKAVEFVKNGPDNLAATITVHHLFLTLEDVIGVKGLQPHNFCKPIAKTEADRKALCKAVSSGNRKFFLGTDSAPHPRNMKECAFGAAGVFTAPVALSLLVQFFEEKGCLDKLEDFISTFGAQFYNLPLNEEKITFVKGPWVVPSKYIVDVVPFMAEKILQWHIDR